MTESKLTSTAEVKPTRTIKKSLAYVQNPVFTDKQMILMLQKTPREHVHEHTGRGGKTFRYITVSYVTMRLNQIFGWSWSFEVKHSGVSPDNKSVYVEGRLSIYSPQTGNLLVVKEAFGGAELKYLKNSEQLVDYADDLKAAESDALKKAASMLGIGFDLYADADTIHEIDQKVLDVRENMLKRQAEAVAEKEKQDAIDAQREVEKSEKSSKKGRTPKKSASVQNSGVVEAKVAQSPSGSETGK